MIAKGMSKKVLMIGGSGRMEVMNAVINLMKGLATVAKDYQNCCRINMIMLCYQTTDW